MALVFHCVTDTSTTWLQISTKPGYSVMILFLDTFIRQTCMCQSYLHIAINQRHNYTSTVTTMNKRAFSETLSMVCVCLPMMVVAAPAREPAMTQRRVWGHWGAVLFITRREVSHANIFRAFSGAMPMDLGRTPMLD